MKHPEITAKIPDARSARQKVWFVRGAMRDAGCSKQEIEQFTDEALKGDTDVVIAEWCNVGKLELGNPR